MTTAKQTPHHSLNNTIPVGEYIFDNSAAILAETYRLPELYGTQRMLTGAVPNPSWSRLAWWWSAGASPQG